MHAGGWKGVWWGPQLAVSVIPERAVLMAQGVPETAAALVTLLMEHRSRGGHYGGNKHIVAVLACMVLATSVYRLVVVGVGGGAAIALFVRVPDSFGCF